MRIIEIKSYNPKWKQLYELECNCIHGILGSNCSSIHHFGSTAIGTIGAKPIVDILVIVKDISNVNPAFEIDPSYICKGEFGIQGRRFIIKGTEDLRSFHIHCFEFGHPEIEWDLWFRDYLTTNLKVAIEYEELKISLSKAFPNSIEEYTKGKDEFIAPIKRKYLKMAQQKDSPDITRAARTAGKPGDAGY